MLISKTNPNKQDEINQFKIGAITILVTNQVDLNNSPFYLHSSFSIHYDVSPDLVVTLQW